MDLKTQESLILELKEMVIKNCRVKNCLPSEISNTETIIGGTQKLKLDSLDAVEIVTSLERQFGVKIENPGEARKILKSFQHLAEFVSSKRKI